MYPSDVLRAAAQVPRCPDRPGFHPLPTRLHLTLPVSPSPVSTCLALALQEVGGKYLERGQGCPPVACPPAPKSMWVLLSCRQVRKYLARLPRLGRYLNTEIPEYTGTYWYTGILHCTLVLPVCRKYYTVPLMGSLRAATDFGRATR